MTDNQDLEELLRIVEKIAIIKDRDRHTIPWELVNQRDVLKKRVNRRQKLLDCLDRRMGREITMYKNVRTECVKEDE